jgi:phosphatidylserine/phosphatidylglycerophosphate/cardiolipin synthase-like enzyme
VNNAQAPEPELVITAPEPYAASLAYATRCRSTVGVLVQLFAEAERNVVIAAPFVDASEIFEVGVLSLAIRAALARGVSVDFLSTKPNIEASRVIQFAKEFEGKVRLYHPAFPQFQVSQLGSHAKFCISDASAAYVGSANLTGPGLNQHFEMGLLVRGRTAAEIRDFWTFAVRYKLFAELIALSDLL